MGAVDAPICQVSSLPPYEILQQGVPKERLDFSPYVHPSLRCDSAIKGDTDCAIFFRALVPGCHAMIMTSPVLSYYSAAFNSSSILGGIHFMRVAASGFWALMKAGRLASHWSISCYALFSHSRQPHAIPSTTIRLRISHHLTTHVTQRTHHVFGTDTALPFLACFWRSWEQE